LRKISPPPEMGEEIKVWGLLITPANSRSSLVP
jgi:hypothetical protein